MSAADRFHLRNAAEILAMEDRLRAGQVPDDKLFDAYVVVTGSEDVAADVYANVMAETLRNGETPQI